MHDKLKHEKDETKETFKSSPIEFTSIFSAPKSSLKVKEGNPYIEIDAGTIEFNKKRIVMLDQEGNIVMKYPNKGTLKDLASSCSNDNDFSVILTGLFYEMISEDLNSVRHLIFSDRCETTNDFLNKVADEFGMKYLGYNESIELISRKYLTTPEDLNALTATGIYGVDDLTKQVTYEGQLEAFYRRENYVGVYMPMLDVKMEYDVSAIKDNVESLVGVICAFRAVSATIEIKYELGEGAEFNTKYPIIDAGDTDAMYKVADILLNKY